MGFLYRLGLGLAVVISVFFRVLGLSLGAGLIIDFVSVRDGLIIALTAVYRTAKLKSPVRVSHHHHHQHQFICSTKYNK